MPMYRRKAFRAQQWNKPGDVPPFAYGMVEEFEDCFILSFGEKVTNGCAGDYICQRPDKAFVYICKREIFEACNELVGEERPIHQEFNPNIE